ncbi:MAG: hypothetical protein ABI591_19260 [Kofleriaceae bacterium]
MPSFDYYALQTESIVILKELMTLGFVAIPEEPRLQKPEIETYTTYVPEIETKLRAFRRLYLQGAFTRDGITFACREGGSAAGTYHIDQMCGPLLAWMLSVVADDPRPTLHSGDIGYASFYVDPKTRQPYAAPRELAEAYKTAVAVFKRHLVRMDHLWVGRLAKEQIERGELFIDR